MNPSPLPPAAAILADPRWTALLARDPAADGTFFYAVRTTGVFCRPSCAARPPRPENVQFFATAQAAEQAGFRACRRCRPTATGAPYAAAIAAACRAIDDAPEPPAVPTLAAAAGLSVSHFHRLFRAATGLTPKAYAAARRADRLRAGLPGAPTVTEALYEAGFQSNSRFYEHAAGELGMAPAAYRTGGARETIGFATGPCSLGRLLVAHTATGICAILLGDDDTALEADLRARFPRAAIAPAAPAFADLIHRVAALIDSPAAGADLPLDVRGTAFQRRVWQALRRIPAGETSTYSAIAAAIGAPTSARAVAQACAANPVAVAIPCHRVVRGDGALSGYRWGAARKRALLDREAER